MPALSRCAPIRRSSAPRASTRLPGLERRAPLHRRPGAGRPGSRLGTPLHRSVRRPPAPMARDRRGDILRSARRLRSCRWDSVFRVSTRKAATCRLAGNARRRGASDCLRACPISSSFCSSANTPQAWHLDATVVAEGLTETVGRWRNVYRSGDRPRLMPIPHPSWRNNAWLKRNPWFELDLLPTLRADVAQIVAPRIEPSRGAARP